MRTTLRGNDAEGYLSAQLAHAGSWTLSTDEQALFLGFWLPRIVCTETLGYSGWSLGFRP